MDLKEESTIGGDPQRHWYYIAKGRAIKSMLGAVPIETLLDVGAGSGVFSRQLVDDGLADRAICVDPHYDDDFMRERGTNAVTYMREASNAEADTVLMIDVIEHVDDDVALIKDHVANAKDGARFLISVPAFQMLWSSHDEFLDHRRRYTLEELERVVGEAGLDVVEARYFFGLLFPAVAALRLADRAMKGEKEATQSALKTAPEWLNRSLVAIHDLERATVFAHNKLAGVTAFCLARKPVAERRVA